nr:hypothetical protein [Tanacetum cinerariifolium]
MGLQGIANMYIDLFEVGFKGCDTGLDCSSGKKTMNSAGVHWAGNFVFQGCYNLKRRDEMKKMRLDHLKQDQVMLVIKIFSKRKKVLERERSVRKFVQRGLIFCKGWSSIYRQEIPAVTGGGLGGPSYIRRPIMGPPGKEYERELLEIGEERLSREDLLEDDIENLKRGDGFSSEDVIEMKRSDYHI